MKQGAHLMNKEVHSINKYLGFSMLNVNNQEVYATNSNRIEDIFVLIITNKTIGKVTLE